MFIPHNDLQEHVLVLHILIFFIHLQPCWCQFPAWVATCFTISTEGEYRRTIPCGAPSTTMSLLVRCRGLGGMQGGNLISKLTSMICNNYIYPEMLTTYLLIIKLHVVSISSGKHFCAPIPLCTYYMLQSSLQIQSSALLDDWTSRAHYFTPGLYCKGFFQNYLYPIFRLFMVTEYKFTISVTQFELFQVFRDSTCSM